MRFITIKPRRLEDDLREKFNGGEFARTNYRVLYEVKMYRGPMRVFLYTPSLSQVWYTFKLMMFGPVYESMPYDQNGHPVQLQTFHVRHIAEKYFTPAELKQQQEKAEKVLSPKPTKARKPANRKAKRSKKHKK